MYCEVGWCDNRIVIVSHFFFLGGGIMIDSFVI